MKQKTFASPKQHTKYPSIHALLALGCKHKLSSSACLHENFLMFTQSAEVFWWFSQPDTGISAPSIPQRNTTSGIATLLFQYLGGWEAREREISSSASEIHEWRNKQSKAVYAHANGNLIKRKQKSNFRVPNQILKLSQKSELYLNQFWTLEDSYSLKVLFICRPGDSPC